MHKDLKAPLSSAQFAKSDIVGVLHRTAERRAEKIERLLDGKSSLGDQLSDFQITRHSDEEGVTYSLKTAAGGDTILNYQCYNPPRYGVLLESMLYAEKNWENGRFANMTEKAMGEYFESLIDDKLTNV